MATKKTASKISLPANRLYVFAKNCQNDHGRFEKGDKARGAFSDELVQSYLAVGILVPVAKPVQEVADGNED